MDWFFPLLNGGEEQGLNESGVQQFKRPESLGRETCQNIGDVRDGSGKPTIAEFELVQLPRDEFPGREKFVNYFTACKEYVLQGLPDGTGNEKDFFENGLKALNSAAIPVLRIGDYNTTGLVGGDNDRTNPFFRLLKQQGASSAQGVGGGTFGIGQRAPFAHSALRTVMYSTKTISGDRVFIAKSLLASFPHPDMDDEITQAKGWWCIPSGDKKSWEAIRDETAIPSRFRREQVGTDLWITGFDTDNWEQKVRHSVLEHFFAAIQKGQIIIRFVENSNIIKEINADNLEQELFNAANELRAAKVPESQIRKGLGSTLYFYKALSDPYNGEPFARIIPKIGEVKFYLYRELKNSDLPERWATMRLPLILVESKGSTLLSNFAGVFICDNDEGNKYLAQLEGATHESWSEKETRNWSHAQMKEAKEVINKITAFVQDVLKEVRGENMKDQEDIPDLGRYLPAEDDPINDDQGGNELSGESTKVETGEQRSRDVKLVLQPNKIANRPTIPVVEEGGDGDGIPPVHDRTKKKKHTKPGTGDKPADSKVLSKHNVRFRSFKVEQGYRVVLESQTAVSGDLKLKAVGEGDDFPVELSSARDLSSGNDLQIKENKIVDLELEASVKKSLLVVVDSDTDLCLAMGGR